jgi:hypothetical protein
VAVLRLVRSHSRPRTLDLLAAWRRRHLMTMVPTS